MPLHWRRIPLNPAQSSSTPHQSCPLAMKKPLTSQPSVDEERDFALKLARVQAGKPLRTIDLFSGCGGLSLGLSSAGYQIAGGIELDAIAARTHAVNFFGHEGTASLKRHSSAHDIRELTPDSFMREVLQIEKPVNAIDMVVGGPPCQAFARVGRAKLREIMQQQQAHLSDSRATLYTYFLEYVEFFRPLVVLLENVPDIMNFGGKNVAEEIADSLEDLGYCSRYTILNAAHYGVPQMRQRFYLIAFLKQFELSPTFPTPTHYIKLPSGYANAQSVALSVMNLTLFNYLDSQVRYTEPPTINPDLTYSVSSQQALEDLPPITEHLNGKMKRGARKFNNLTQYRPDCKPSEYAHRMRTWSGLESDKGVWDHVTRHLPRDYQIFARMQPGDQYPQAYAIACKMFEEARELLKEELGREVLEGSEEYERLWSQIVPPYDPGKFPNKWRKMERDLPARTLTAHIGKDTYSHIHYDSEQARTISVREAARLQSFPDGFRFEGAMNAAFRQIGNAVPPLQAHALGTHIYQTLHHAALEIVLLDSVQEKEAESQ